MTTNLDEQRLKSVLKEALTETLHEQRDFLRDVFTEVLEDACLVEAIKEGIDSKPATRAEVFRHLASKP